MSADAPEKLRLMVEKNDLSAGIRFFSDPDLLLAEHAQVPISRYHPKAFGYPKKAFLQPAVFVFDAKGVERFAWRINPGIFNLFGAVRRMTPSECLEEVRRVAAATGPKA